MARSMSLVAQRCALLSNRSWRTAVSISLSSMMVSLLDDITIGVERYHACTAVGLDVDVAVSVKAEQTGVIHIAVGNGQVADGDVGSDVAGTMRRELNICTHRRTGEVCFVDHAERTVGNATITVYQRKRLRAVGGDVDAVELLIAGHEGNAPGGWRGIGACSVGKHRHYHRVLRVMLVEEQNGTPRAGLCRGTITCIGDRQPRQYAGCSLKQEYGSAICGRVETLKNTAFDNHDLVPVPIRRGVIHHTPLACLSNCSQGMMNVHTRIWASPLRGIPPISVVTIHHHTPTDDRAIRRRRWRSRDWRCCLRRCRCGN